LEAGWEEEAIAREEEEGSMVGLGEDERIEAQQPYVGGVRYSLELW
jgi:hypothetical protein